MSLQRITKEPGRNEREGNAYEGRLRDTVRATTAESRREIGKITRIEIERKMIRLEGSLRK